MEPVHTEGQVLHHLELLQQGDVNLGVVKQVVEGSSREELRNDGEVARLGTRSHEEDNVGVAQVTV